VCLVQDLRVCKVESTKFQADLFEKDSLLQRKEVEVSRNTLLPQSDTLVIRSSCSH